MSAFSQERGATSAFKSDAAPPCGDATSISGRTKPIMKTPLEIAPPQIRVIIADDHPVIRHGLRSIFKSQKDFRVVAEATDGEETCQLCNQLLPDVLLLDLHMPKKDGLQVIAELLSGAGGPKPQIVVMTAYEGEEDIRRALNSGAKGYLLKGADLREIREAVRKVAAGQSILPADVAAKLADSMPRSELSERELLVLQYIANGRRNKEIAQLLCLSVSTVKVYASSILKKLKAICRTEAIAVAARSGLLRANSNQLRCELIASKARRFGFCGIFAG
jgi:two-component system, NarL family, response regulator